MTPWVLRLLIANVIVYFLQQTVPGLTQALWFMPMGMWTRPWTIVTYMFVHAWLAHLAFNLFTLWMFGPRLEHAWGARTFTQFYLWCGLGGAVAHLLFAQHSSVIGASGAISGVLVAYAIHWPDEEVYLFGVIPMKSRWLIAAMIGMNIIFALAPSSRIDWTAHVGGMSFGWLFLKLYSLGGLDRVRGWVSSVPDESEEMPRAVPRTRSSMQDRERGVDEVVARSNAVVLRERKPLTHAPKQETPQEYAAKIDGVLDKISQQGIGSLTRDERRMLEDMSRKLRDE